MLFIVEGPDGTGKTTLLKKLRKSLPFYTWFVASNSKPKSTVDIVEYMEWLSMIPPNQPLFSDRFPPISESIYGPVLRNKNLSPFQTPELADYLKKLNAVIIYCAPRSPTIKANLKKNPQRSGLKTHIETIIQKYDSQMTAFENEGIEVFPHNYEQEDMCITPVAIKNIVRSLKR